MKNKRLEQIKEKYKKNKDGAVERECFVVNSINKEKREINFSTTKEFIYSEEVEDIHFLLDIVEMLTKEL